MRLDDLENIEAAASESPPPRVSPDGQRVIEHLMSHLNTPGTTPEVAEWAVRCAIEEVERDARQRIATLEQQRVREAGVYRQSVERALTAEAESAALRAQVAALVEALEQARVTIRTWHNMGMNRKAAAQAWGAYWKNAPELASMRAALAAPQASAAALLERVRAEERERCAKIAETRADACGYKMPVWGEPDPEHYIERHHEALSIAAAIRAGEPKP